MNEPPTDGDRRRIFRESRAAAYCGLADVTFRRLRKAELGPKAVRLTSRCWGYRLIDLDEWLESRVSSGRAA